MNILQLLNEKAKENNGLTFLVSSVWSSAISDVKKILAEKNLGKKEKIVNEQQVYVAKIGPERLTIKVNYSNLRNFLKSVIAISIFDYLYIKYRRRLEIWWDEVDKLASVPAMERINFINKNFPSSRVGIDKRKVISLFQEEYPEISKNTAAMYYGSIFGAGKRIKETEKKVSDINISQGAVASGLGTSVEALVVKLLPRDISITKHPNGKNEFPDLLMNETPQKGLFNEIGLKAGDWVEIKSANAPEKARALSKIKQKFKIDDTLKAEDLIKAGKRNSFAFFGLSNPTKGKDLYFFSRAGKSSSFNIYKMPTDFPSKATFKGEYSFKDKSGDLRMEYGPVSIPFKFVSNKGKFLSGGSIASISNKVKERIFQLVKTVPMEKLRNYIREVSFKIENGSEEK